MTTTQPLLFAAAADNSQVDARQALDAAGLTFKPWSFQSPTEPDSSAGRLALVDSSGAVEAAAGFCRRWRAKPEAAPVLWLADTPDARLAGWQAGVDAVLPRPFLAAELTGQLDAL